MLRAALSVNTSVPLVAVPGDRDEMVKVQTPPAGSVIGSNVAPVVQEMGPIVKVELGEVAAEESVRGAWPMSDTLIDCVETPLKPRLPAE